MIWDQCNTNTTVVQVTNRKRTLGNGANKAKVIAKADPRAVFRHEVAMPCAACIV
jgi:hypothetical protein